MSANTPISSSSHSPWLKQFKGLIQHPKPPLSMAIQWPSSDAQEMAARQRTWSVMHSTPPSLNDISTFMHTHGLGVISEDSEIVSRRNALVQHNGSAGSPQITQSQFQVLDFFSNLPARIFGPSLEEKMRYLRENGDSPPSGLLQRALYWPLQKGIALVKGPVERYTFFQKGRLLLQNPLGLNADLKSWCQQALNTYKFSSAQKALLTRCSSAIIKQDLEELKLLVAAELGLSPAELPLSHLPALAAQALFFKAQTALPAMGWPQAAQNPGDQLGFIHEIEKILQGADLTSEVGRMFARNCVLPSLQFILEKIEQSPSTQQLHPYVHRLKTQLSAVGSALENKSPEEIRSAFRLFTQVLNQRPPIALQGVGIIGAGSLSEPVSIRPLDEDLLTPSHRHETFEVAKEVTDHTMARFQHAFSAYSTLSICNLFIKTSDQTKYEYPELLEKIELKKLGCGSLSEKEFFIRELQNLIQKDKEANWLKRFFFGSRHVLSLIFWFSEKIVSVCSQSILTKMRSDMQQIHCESGESSTKRLPFELLNSPLSNMIRMYRSAAQPEPGKHRDPGSLETVMESVSKEPGFYDGMSETTLKNRVADKIISDYLPRVKLEEGYLELIKGLPGQSVLKVLLPIVRALDYIPNKFIAWFSRKLLNETDALTVIFDSIKTKRNQSTNLELTIYQSLHEELARVYKGMQDPGNEDAAEVQLSSQGLKEIRALCHQIAQIRRLKGFTTEKQLSDYMKNGKPLAEQAEGYLIDQNETILGDLFMSVYRSVTDKISLETQLNTVVETAISSIESSANPDPGALQKQIASEKDSIGRLMRSILQISIDRGIDSALESKPYQTEAMAQIKKMVSIQLLRESIKNLKNNNSNRRSDKAANAHNLRLLLKAAQRQILVYSSSLDRSQTLNPTDLNLLKTRLSTIIASLDEILLQASVLTDRYTYESLVSKPEALIKRLLAVLANPVPGNKRELGAIRELFIASRHLFNKFSQWGDLDSSITSACALAGKLTSQEGSRLGQEQRALIDEVSAKLRALEQTFSALPDNLVSNETILEQLEQASSEGQELNNLLEAPLERQEVNIPFLTKDSSVVRMAKNQATSVLNSYLNDMVVLLADPLLHEVTLKTWLASFVNYKK